MSSTRWNWLVVATLALGIGLFSFPGHSPAQTTDRDDDDAGAAAVRWIGVAVRSVIDSSSASSAMSLSHAMPS